MRLPSLLHSQREDEGEHRRKIQSNAEDAHVAIFDKTPDVVIHRRPSGLCSVVQRHPHRSMGMAPSQVSAKNQEEVWQRLYSQEGKGVPKIPLKNRVRISKVKRLLKKGYMANWSEEIFTIHEVHPSDPPVY